MRLTPLSPQKSSSPRTAWFALPMATLSMAILAAAAPEALAAEKFPAELVGHAIVPAQTFVAAPEDAPALFRTSGKFTAGDRKRVDELYSIPGASFLSAKEAPRRTGLHLPFVGQPVQGFSGIQALEDGSFAVLIDNGFGSKANSADAMLMTHRIAPDWETGRVTFLDTLFLRDPDKVIPFPITTEATAERYLTGADLDLEGMQVIGDTIWFGDEFGPYLFATDLEGKVIAFHETEVDGRVVRSPDHYRASLPSVPGETVFEVRRSRGFEGLAQSVDGRFLYPLFEGPLWDAEAKAFENRDGAEFLRIVEFDVAARAFTGRQWKYALEVNGHNIGDFNMIDASRGLVIERDGGEGDPAQACGGTPAADCFNNPARFKRVYMIDMSQTDADGFVKKRGYVDLMDIDDPKRKARLGGDGEKFTFPFVTIEDVDLVDAEHIIVANDNNLPFSSGRALGQPDHNEFILLNVRAFLDAR